MTDSYEILDNDSVCIIKKKEINSSLEVNKIVENMDNVENKEVWETLNFRFVKEKLDNKTVFSIKYKDTKDTKDTKEKKRNMYKYYFGKCSGIIGAAILMKYYTNSHDNFELLNYYDKIYKLSIPLIVGYNLGEYITPISLVYSVLFKYL